MEDEGKGEKFEKKRKLEDKKIFVEGKEDLFFDETESGGIIEILKNGVTDEECCSLWPDADTIRRQL